MIKFFNNRIFILYVFPLILGGLSTLSFQPFNYFIFNFFSLSGLFLLILYVKKKSKGIYRKKPFKKNLFILGTFFGFGFFFFNIYWIVYSLTFDSSFKIFIPFGLILIPLFLSIFFSFPIIFLGNFVDEKISSLILFSTFFGLADFLRGTILTGFPWNSWIYSLSAIPENLQLLSSLGFYSLNILTIMIFFSPAVLFFKNKAKYSFLSIILIFLFSNYFYGSYKINSSSHKDKKDLINFKIVTAGINLSDFTDIESVTTKLIKYSEPKKEKKTIFVWPEGTFSSQNFNNIKNNKKIKNKFKNNFSKNHLIIIGSNTEKISKNEIKYFNSLIILDNEFNIISKYDKKKLVPFGEFLPFEKYLSFLGLKKITPGYSSFSKGETNSTININFNNSQIKLLPLICYEIIFPELVDVQKEYFNFVINISEDAWFGESIGPYQHFSKAVFRSIESGVFTIRSANKGKSVFIDPHGKILNQLEPNEVGNIELSLPVVNSNKSDIKKSLIFFLVLITYIFTFLILRKFKN